MAEKAKKSFFEKGIFKTLIKSDKVSLVPEAGVGYLLGPMLAILGNGIVNTYLIQYWDKVLSLGTWAALFETLLPIISAIFIVIGNLVVGRLMERNKSFAGKARPLILLGMPFIAIALLALFLVPFPQSAGGTNSDILALIIVAVGYNLYYAIAWPIYYTSHSAMVNLSTRDDGKRGLLSTAAMAAQLGAAGLAGMVGPFLVDIIGLFPTATITAEQANSKWTLLMIVMIAALVIGCVLEYYFTRERITEENILAERAAEQAGKKTEAKKVSMGEQAKICFKDTYWWLIIIFFFLYQFGGQMKNNSLSWLSMAVLGNNQVSLAGTISTIGAIPTAVGMALVWPLAKALKSKAKAIIIGCAVAVVGGAASFLILLPQIGTDYVALSAVSTGAFCLKALGTTPAMYMSLALLAQVMDHQEAKYGVRTDGFTMAVYGSIMVAMAGICNGIIAGVNALVPMTTDGSIIGEVFTDFQVNMAIFNDPLRQTSAFVNTFLAYGVEAICYLLMGVLFIKMNVEKYSEEDQKILAERNGVKAEEPAK